MSDEQLITAAAKIDAHQIHLPDDLLQRIQQQAYGEGTTKPRRFRLGPTLEILAASLILGALLTFGIMGGLDRRPAAPPTGSGTGQSTTPITLPRLVESEVQSVTISWTGAGRGQVRVANQWPTATPAIIEAYNRARAYPLSGLSTPHITVTLQLASGEKLTLAILDSERVATQVEGQLVEIRSPELSAALRSFSGPFADVPGTVAVEMADGRGGYIVRGPSTDPVIVSLEVAGQLRQRVEAPAVSGWYTAFLDPIRVDDLPKGEIIVTTTNGVGVTRFPVPNSPHLGTYSQNFEEVFVQAADDVVEIQGKTRLPDGRFLVEVRTGEQVLAATEVQLLEGSRVQVKVPGGIPEGAEVWFYSDTKIEMALPIIYRK